jgi:hypothetical protein
VGFRPRASLAYERMFPRDLHRPPNARTLGARLQAALARVLEAAGGDAEWEAAGPEPWVGPPHPHRRPLRRPFLPRRPGMVASREQVCLTPIGRRANGAQAASRGLSRAL